MNTRSKDKGKNIESPLQLPPLKRKRSRSKSNKKIKEIIKNKEVHIDINKDEDKKEEDKKDEEVQVQSSNIMNIENENDKKEDSFNIINNNNINNEEESQSSNRPAKPVVQKKCCQLCKYKGPCCICLNKPENLMCSSCRYGA